MNEERVYDEEQEARISDQEQVTTIRLDEELMDRLESIFSNAGSAERSSHDLAKIASEYGAIDLAYAAVRLPLSRRIQIFKELDDPEDIAHFFMHVDSATRCILFPEMEDEEIAQMIEEMPNDEAVWVLEDLVLPRYPRVMNLLDPNKAQAITDLSKHTPNSAGRLMTNEFFAFRMDTTIGEAAAFIRDHPRIDLLRRIFVLDDEAQLQGFVPLRNLVINPPSLPLRKVMRQITHMVATEASRDEVIEIFDRYKAADLPVVDEEGRLVGVITYEDVAEAIEDQTDETLALISGTSHEVRMDDPVWKSILARSPWLVVTLIAGLINANNMVMFEIHREFIVFVPLVIGMSGNIGIQCSTLMIRAMAMGYVTTRSAAHVVWKEIKTALMTGLGFGVFCGLSLYFLGLAGFFESSLPIWKLAFIVSVGQIGACMFGAIIGAWSPILFHRMGFDPAISSGPITTAFNDVIANLMYFVIAAWLLAILLM